VTETSDLFAPLHAEAPPDDAWARVSTATATDGGAEPDYLDSSVGRDRRRPARWLAVAAAVVLVALVGALALRGSDPDPRPLEQVGPCALEGFLIGDLVPVPIEPGDAQNLLPEAIARLGPVSVLQARDGQLVVEVYVGDFRPEELHGASAPPDNRIIPRDGAGTMGPNPDPTPGCATVGVYAVGADQATNGRAAEQAAEALGG